MSPVSQLFAVLILVGRRRTDTAVPKEERGVDPGGVVQPFMDWVANEWVDMNWDASPVSCPFTGLSHRGEFKK